VGVLFGLINNFVGDNLLKHEINLNPLNLVFLFVLTFLHLFTCNKTGSCIRIGEVCMSRKTNYNEVYWTLSRKTNYTVVYPTLSRKTNFIEVYRTLSRKTNYNEVYRTLSRKTNFI